MSNTNQQDKLDYIEELAAEGRVPEAAGLLSEYLSDNKDTERLRTLQALLEDYKRMLDYFLTGNPDPYRHTMHCKISSSILSMAADCRREIRVKDGTDLFATKARFENLQGQTLAQRLADYLSSCMQMEASENPLSASGERDTRLNLFFYKLWTLRDLSKKDVKSINKYMMDTSGDFLLQAQTINALFFRAMEFFDYKVILMLADYVEGAPSEKVAARALTALLLLLTIHRKKIEGDQLLQHRFDLWKENLIMYRRLREVVSAIIRTRDTQRISDTMKSDVIPNLMKMRPEIMKKMRDLTPDFDPAMLEENPEWEKMMNRNGLSDKLRELSELQSEGADVMMVAFANLKQYPFFNELGNWLLPFDMSHSSLSALKSMNLSGMEHLFSSPAMMMCDSDKYSLALSMALMPEQQRNMTLSQLDAQLSQLDEEQKERMLKTTMPEFDREANMYVRDLYRFFKLNPRHKEFPDPFERFCEFTRLPAIGEILMESDITEIAAEFYFRHGYYRDVLKIFNEIEKHREPDGSRYEKIGFCYQKLGNLEKALENYDKAVLCTPESDWLKKKRAFCHRQSGNFRIAAQLYLQLLEKTPDNLNMICSLADCLAAEGDYANALKEYYKADYLHPGNHKVERAIAWNEFRCKHHDKSRQYHEKVLSDNPEGRDYINAGHAALIAGQPGDARRLYREGLGRYANREEFDAALLADKDILLEMGMDPTDLQLMINASYM